MKFVKLTFILFMFALPIMKSSALALVVGAIDSVSSDCKTITVAYTISFNSGEDIFLTATGLSESIDVADNNTNSLTFPITEQLDGTAITVKIKYDTFDVATMTINCSATEILIPLINDTRINDGRVEPFWSDHVIYPANEGIFIYSDEGEIALYISKETIEMFGVPDDTPSRLLGETLDAYVRVYRLSDGRYQVMVGPDSEAKTHIVIWEGLGYAFNIETSTLP